MYDNDGLLLGFFLLAACAVIVALAIRWQRKKHPNGIKDSQVKFEDEHW